MDVAPAQPEGHIPYIRISLVHKPEKQQRLIEDFAQALATCHGNQVWLGKCMDERDRQVRRQIATARALGTDIPLRAIAIMRERGIVPHLAMPPGAPPLVDTEEIFAEAIKRATARAETIKPAKKRKAAKKKPKRKPSNRPV